jgi:hypothetical protein
LDLGSPILDVQMTITYYNSSQVSAIEPTTKVVTNGVVTAAGYDPIVIYNVPSADTNTPGGSTTSYIPTFPDFNGN